MKKGIWASTIILLLSILPLSAFEIWIVQLRNCYLPKGRFWWIWALFLFSFVLICSGAWAMRRARKGRHFSAFLLSSMAVAVCTVTIVHFSLFYGTRYRHHYDQLKVAFTINKMRPIATAWEEYFLEKETYASPGTQPVQFQWGNISGDQLYRMLVANNKKRPLDRKSFFDGWGRPYQFGVYGIQGRCSDDHSCGFGIRSAGQDGQWDASRYLHWPTEADADESDNILTNIGYVRAPWSGPGAVGPAPIPFHPIDREVFPPLN